MGFLVKKKEKEGEGVYDPRTEEGLYPITRLVQCVQCAHELGTLNKANLISLCYLRNTSAHRLF